MFKRVAILLVFLASPLVAQEAILRVNPNGHHADCMSVKFTPDGDELISAGLDKTIRVWRTVDPTSIDAVRTHRMQIGDGLDGGVNVIAVNPKPTASNKRIMAVAGLFHATDPATASEIRLLDRDTGEILATLPAHENIVQGLSFSTNGKKLVSAGSDNCVRVWDLNELVEAEQWPDNPAEIPSTRFPTYDPVSYAELIANNQLVAISANKVIRWKKTEAEWKAQATRLPHPIATCCIHHRTKRLAASCRDGRVHLVDLQTLGARQIYSIGGKPKRDPRVAFTKNGSQLVMASRSSSETVVYDVVTSQVIRRIKGFADGVSQIAIHPSKENIVAMCDNRTHEVSLWDMTLRKQIAKQTTAGERVGHLAISADGRHLGFTREIYVLNDPEITNVIDLEDFGHLPKPEGQAYRVAPGGNDWIGPQLSDAKYGFNNVGRGLSLFRLDKSEQQMHELQGIKPMDKPKVACFLNKAAAKRANIKHGVLVGTQFAMYLLDADTRKMKRQFVGHDSSITSIVVSPNGKFFASASTDKTIRFWKIDDEPDLKASPMLTLFVDRSDRWVAWKPTGHYKATLNNADSLFGWHFNKGRNEKAIFLQGDEARGKFREKFLKPDEIDSLFSESEAHRAARPIVVGQRLDAVPEIFIDEPKGVLRTNKNKVKIRGRIKTNGGGLDRIDLRINGRPVKNDPIKVAKDDVVEFTFQLAIQNSAVVELLASSTMTTVKSREITIIRTNQPAVAKQEPAKPNLHFLGVAVSQYDDEKLRLSYPTDDVLGISIALQAGSPDIYDDFRGKNLFDEFVTVKNIQAELNRIRHLAHPSDVMVFALAGHGWLNDGGEFYFAPKEFDQSKPEKSGVPWSVVAQELGRIPCRKLVLLDTCHSGKIVSNRRHRREYEKLITELSDETESGGTYVLASAMGNEKAEERDEWKHGAFSLAIIEALTGTQVVDPRETTLPAEPYVDVLSLRNYVKDRVQELTKGKQHTQSDNPPKFKSFPIATVADDR